MAVTQYIGARYVPLFSSPLDWDITKEYEPLTIVYYAGNSYTSRQAVPKGIEITNDDYWALTGNYNAQIEQYRKEVAAYDAKIKANTVLINEESSRANAAEQTNSEAIAAEKSRAMAAEQTNSEAIAAEKSRAMAAEQTNSEAIAAEKGRAMAAEQTNSEAIANMCEQAKDVSYNGFYDMDTKAYVHVLKLSRKKYDFPAYNIGLDISSNYEFVRNGNFDDGTFLINGPHLGVLISKGSVVNDLNEGGYNSEYWYLLCQKKDGTFFTIKDTNHTIKANEAKNEGAYNAFGIWHPVIENGVAFVPSSNLPTSENNYDYIIKRKHQRSIIGFDDDYWYFVLVEGRMYRSEGIDFEGELSICRKLGISNAYNMDGGHSTQAWSSSPVFNFVRQNTKASDDGYASGRIFAFLRMEKKND